MKMLRELTQTVFHVEPLKNVVGVGNTAAYQIVICSRRTLGTVGTVSVPAYAEICNDAHYTTNSADASGDSRLGTWFRRRLATLAP